MGWSGVSSFFFKQKTAYDIVSRDWSSDVCSSDLTSSCRDRGPGMSWSSPGGPGRLAGDGAVVARAPAKVNVHLAVGPLRSDGFHELRTVYLAVSLFDTVTVRPARRLSLPLSGEGAGELPTDRG